jgi:putative oxidoreductase
MLQRFFRTDPSSWTQLALRLVVAAVILPHGAQKLLGWFGGYGPEATLGGLASLGTPRPLGWLVILVESVGALALVAGLGTRLVSAGLFATMLGAVLMVHLPHGFFMNWGGQQAGEGVEFFLPMLTMTALLTVLGAGRYSLDGWLARRLDAARRETRSGALDPTPRFART